MPRLRRHSDDIDAVKALPGVRCSFIVRAREANPGGVLEGVSDGVAIVATSWWAASRALRRPKDKKGQPGGCGERRRRLGFAFRERLGNYVRGLVVKLALGLIACGLTLSALGVFAASPTHQALWQAVEPV